jgi:hypothetical protein
MGGKAKEPKAPPPPPAPVRADMAQGEQALMAAGRRQGLRSTITPQSAMLGAQTALGAGSGPIAAPKYSAPIQGYATQRKGYTGNDRMGKAIYTAMGGAAGVEAMSSGGSGSSGKKALLGFGV